MFPLTPSPFTLIDRSPAAVAAPGKLTARFELDGTDADMWTAFYVEGTALSNSRFTDPIRTIDYPVVTVDGPARVSGRGDYAVGYDQTCARGGVMIDGDDAGYTVVVPARSTSIVTVSGDVPVGFDAPADASPLPANAGSGSFGFTLTSGTLVPYSPEPGVPALPTTQILPGGAAFQTVITGYRTAGFLDGVTLHGETTHGHRVLTGQIQSGRAGVRVDILGRSGAVRRPDDIFGRADSVAGAVGRRSLESYARTRTTTGGRFRATVRAPAGATVFARSAAHGSGAAGRLAAGASCPIALSSSR